MRERLRRWLEARLPWYDPEAEARHRAAVARDRRTAARVRAAYIAYAERVERK